MKVTVESLSNDDPRVTMDDVRYIKLDRGEQGEIIISNRAGVLSIYQNGKVIYTEEKKKNRFLAVDPHAGLNNKR
jgi:hypothetical protein